MDMQTGNGNVQTYHDCALIRFEDSKSRVRRQVPSDVIFGPNRPSTRFRFSDMPSRRRAKVVTTQGRANPVITQGKPRMVHRIVMASETNEVSEIKSESGNQAAVSSNIITVSGTGNQISRSSSSTVTSEKTENQASSGTRSNIVIVRKANPVNINFARANVNTIPQNTNLLASRRRGADKINTVSGVRTNDSPVLLLGAKAGNIANYITTNGAGNQKLTAEDARLATARRSGNQGNVLSEVRTGVQRRPSNLYTASVNNGQRNLNTQVNAGIPATATNLLTSSRQGTQNTVTTDSRTGNELSPKIDPRMLIDSGRTLEVVMNQGIPSDNKIQTKPLNTNLLASRRKSADTINVVSGVRAEDPGMLINARTDNQGNMLSEVRTEIQRSPSDSSDSLSVDKINVVSGVRTEDPGMLLSARSGDLVNSASANVVSDQIVTTGGSKLITARTGNHGAIMSEVGTGIQRGPSVSSDLHIASANSEQRDLSTLRNVGPEVQTADTNLLTASRQGTQTAINTNLRAVNQVSSRDDPRLLIASGRNIETNVNRGLSSGNSQEAQLADINVELIGKHESQSNRIAVVGTNKQTLPSGSSRFTDASSRKTFGVRPPSVENSQGLSTDISDVLVEPKENPATVNTGMRIKSHRPASVSSDLFMANRRNFNTIKNIATKSDEGSPFGIQNVRIVSSKGNGANDIALKDAGSDRPLLDSSNILTASRRTNVNTLHVNKPVETSELPLVKTNLASVSQRENWVNRNIDIRGGRDRRPTVSSNILIAPNRDSVSSLDIQPQVKPVPSIIINDISSIASGQVPSFNSGSANDIHFSNFSGIATTEMPLDWSENGTHFDNSSYFNNYTEYGNYSFDNNGTFYPENFTTYVNETAYGNYSYNHNETMMYPDNFTLYNNETATFITIPTTTMSSSLTQQTTTDRYSNINFRNLPPARVSYLPDYRNNIDDHGGVPVLSERKRSKQTGVGSNTARDKSNMESNIAKHVVVNTSVVSKNAVISDTIADVTNTNTEWNILIQENTKPSAEENIIHTPKVVVTYPVDSNSVAVDLDMVSAVPPAMRANSENPESSLSVGIRKDIANVNQQPEGTLEVAGTTLTLETDLTRRNFTMQIKPDSNLAKSNNRERLQRGSIDVPPIIVPNNQLPQKDNVKRNTLNQFDADRRDSATTGTETIDNISARDKNYLFTAPGSAPRDMPPVFSPTQKPLHRAYPGYELINMINNNRASKTSFDLFDANRLNRAKSEQAEKVFGDSAEKGFTLGFRNVLNPVGNLNSGETNINTEVKTVWEGPGIVSKTTFIADNMIPTGTGPEMFNRRRPPSLRPKLAERQINVAESVANLTTGLESRPKYIASNPAEDNMNALPADITPEYIATINRDIQLINDRLMNSLEQNANMRTGSIVENVVQTADDISIANEIADILRNFTNDAVVTINFSENITNNGAESVSLNETGALNSTYTTAIKPLAVAQNQIQEVQNLIAKSTGSGLNNKEFDNISVKILQTLEKIVRELQLTRELAIKRQEQLSRSTDFAKINPAFNNIDLFHNVRTNNFDLETNIPGVERKIGNVQTFATNIELLNKRLPKDGLSVESNPLWQVHPSLLSVLPTKSQGGISNVDIGGRRFPADTNSQVPSVEANPWMSKQYEIGSLNQSNAPASGSNIPQNGAQRNNLTASDALFQFTNALNSAADSLNNGLQASKNSPLANSINTQLDRYQNLSAFANSRTLVRNGIPINLNIVPFPSVSEAVMTPTAGLNQETAGSLEMGHQSNVNTANIQPQLDGFVNSEQLMFNKTKNNWKQGQQANLDNFENVLNETGAFSKGSQKVNEFYAPGIVDWTTNNENNMDFRNQVYDLSGLTEEQKSQVTRSLSNIFPKSRSSNLGSSSSSIRDLNPTIYLCPNGDRFTCQAVGIYHEIPGMQWWCVNHCRLGPCPREKCTCTCDLTYQQTAQDFGSIIVETRPGLQQDITADSSQSRSNASDAGVENGQLRKKIFKKVITLTLNGSKEQEIQVNEQGPEAMVSRAPQILTSPITKSMPVTGNSKTREHFSVDSKKTDIRNDASLAVQVNDNSASSGGIYMFPDARSDTKNQDVNIARTQSSGNPRYMIIDNRLVCRGIGKFENIEGIVQWCTTMCRQGTCPEFVCSCLS